MFLTPLRAKKLTSISCDSALSALQNAYLIYTKRALLRKVLPEILKIFFAPGFCLLSTVPLPIERPVYKMVFSKISEKNIKQQKIRNKRSDVHMCLTLPSLFA